MAYLYRLGTALLFALTLAMIWSPARAAESPVTQYTGRVNPLCPLTGYSTSVNVAGADAVACRNIVFPNPPNSTCGFTHAVGLVAWGNCPPTVGAVSIVSFGSRSWCVTANVAPSSEGLCPDPVENCKAVADALNYINAPLVHYGSVGLTACYGGFVIAGSGGASGGGQSELYGPFKCSGDSPSACSPVPKPSSIVVTCKQGEYPGEVNGVQVCVPPSSSVDAPKTTTATPPTPGASAPPIPNAPPGTASQSEQTTCTGTTCTKTTTYKDPAGATTGTKTEEQSKASYCADNPKAPGCSEEKSSFSGSCAGGFVGQGDALQIAIAREQHTRNCQFYENPTEQAKFNTEAAKTGKQYTEDVVAISSASFSQTNLLGVSAQCITDKTITVMTATAVLPFSRVCPSLDQLGTVLLGVSFIAALMIVAKGKD